MTFPVGTMRLRAKDCGYPVAIPSFRWVWAPCYEFVDNFQTIITPRDMKIEPEEWL